MSTINELLNEQQQPKNKKASEAERKMTVKTIDEYLGAHQDEASGLYWLLHCLFRSGKGEDYGFNKFDIEHMQFFFDALLRTFINPEATKIFCEVSQYDAEHLADHLTRLRDFFRDVAQDHIVEAHLDRIECGYFGCLKTSTELYNTRLQWMRQDEIDTAKKDAVDKYRNQFRH